MQQIFYPAGNSGKFMIRILQRSYIKNVPESLNFQLLSFYNLMPFNEVRVNVHA